MQSTMTYVLSHIRQNIPPELLNLAFRPQVYNTTIEQRIISEIIEGPVLLDTNLVGGKRRDIFLHPQWLMNLPASSEFSILGAGVESSFYLVPPEARENRNISSVIGVAQTVSTALSGAGFNGQGGNTVNSMLSQMLNTRTFANTPRMPLLTLEGTNIIRCQPERLMEEMAITVMLEYDSEFMNMGRSEIFAMQRLCLCAVHRYIANNLVVPIDETEIVAGMEIGVIRRLVDDYAQKGEQYQELLIKLKGAMTYSMPTISRLIGYGL